MESFILSQCYQEDFGSTNNQKALGY